MRVSIYKSVISTCVMVLLISLAHPAFAAISTTGNVEPANPATWGSSTVGIIGNTSGGTMDINDNSDVTNMYGHIGLGSGVTGKVAVDGAGSTWTNTTGLYLGNSGNGTLEITNGGVVTVGRIWLGNAAGSSGVALVDGGGSRLANAYYFHLAIDGEGDMDITNGGWVNSHFGYIGYNSGSTGVVTVSGVGSKWTNSGGLRVGYNGIGTLEILNGGLVSVAEGFFIDFDEDGDGFVNMDGGGMLALKGDVAGSLNDFLGLVSTTRGTKAIRYWNGSAWDDITHATEDVDYRLDYHATGDLADYTTLTVGVIPEPATILLMFAGLPLIKRKK